MRGAEPLHLSQKVFWFCASACLILGTVVFAIQVLRGHAAAIRFMGIEITSAKAEASIIAARDRLLAIRTKLNDAVESGEDVAKVDELMPEFDDVLKALGVAEAAIKHRDSAVWTFSSYGSYNPIDGMHDGDGGDSPGYGYVSPTPKPPEPTTSAASAPRRRTLDSAKP